MDPQNSSSPLRDSASQRSTGRTAQKAATRAAISAAVIDLLEERGFGNFTAEDAATAAGVSRRTFFNHFGSVEEACYSYTSDLMEQLHERMVPLIHQGMTYLQAHEIASRDLRSTETFRNVARSALSWERMRQTSSNPRYAQLTWDRAVKSVQHMLAELERPGLDGDVEADPQGQEEQRIFLASSLVAAWGTAYLRWAATCEGDTGPESMQQLDRLVTLSTRLLMQGNTWPVPQPQVEATS